jgi:hypothetical protein
MPLSGRSKRHLTTGRADEPVPGRTVFEMANTWRNKLPAKLKGEITGSNNHYYHNKCIELNVVASNRIVNRSM